jgi:hypothetical protein
MVVKKWNFSCLEKKLVISDPDLGCAMEKTAWWNFLKLSQIMYLAVTIQWCKIFLNWTMGKFWGYPGLHP